MTNSRWRLLLPLAYMAALLMLSSVPGRGVDSPAGAIFQWLTPSWQNLLHIPLYGGLAASWLWALAALPLSHAGRLAAVLLLTLSWAAVDELYQSTVPGRYGSATDLALNAIGACLVVLYARWRGGETSPVTRNGPASDGDRA
jgi:hypothetical protein